MKLKTHSTSVTVVVEARIPAAKSLAALGLMSSPRRLAAGAHGHGSSKQYGAVRLVYVEDMTWGNESDSQPLDGPKMVFPLTRFP